jgi:hypothetical protein
MLLQRVSARSLAIAISLTASLLYIGSLPSLAQNFRGQVRGVVAVPSGEVLPGATVVLANTSTGVNATKQADAAGLYVFDFVEPGAYRITVEMAGFGTFVQQNVVVQAGGDVTVNVTLSPGTVQQTVTVSATPPNI